MPLLLGARQQPGVSVVVGTNEGFLSEKAEEIWKRWTPG